MHSHPWTLAVVAAGVLALQSAACDAAEPKVGEATATKNQVQGILEGKARVLSSGHEVFSNETVRTGVSSLADLRFLDSTNLNVGPTSEIRLDEFVYDPGGSSGSLVLQATRGAFRFVTGTQDKRAYQIKTPYGTLGVRGTIVEFSLTPCTPLNQNACGLKARVDEGSATLTLNSGQVVEIPTNTVVSVSGNGVATATTSDASILNFASAASSGTTTAASAGGGGGGGGGGTGGQIGPLQVTRGTNTGLTDAGNTSAGVASAFFTFAGAGATSGSGGFGATSGVVIPGSGSFGATSGGVLPTSGVNSSVSP